MLKINILSIFIAIFAVLQVFLLDEAFVIDMAYFW